MVAIAHRLHTAHDADRIAVVIDGRIAELGSHHELVGRRRGVRPALAGLDVLADLGLARPSQDDLAGLSPDSEPLVGGARLGEREHLVRRGGWIDAVGQQRPDRVHHRRGRSRPSPRPVGRAAWWR